jgi:hypothetical protein
MRSVRHTILLFAVCLGLPCLKAQSDQAVIPCATPPLKSNWLTEFQKRQVRPELRSDESKYIAMSIHIVGTHEGKQYLNTSVILDALCMLNEKFALTGLQFFVKDDFKYINNDVLFAHDKISFPQIPALFSRYNVPHTVNVYFVSDPMGACGYNYMPGGKSVAIVLSNDCTNGRDANWAHEMGHYLSLPHTFYGWEMQAAELNKPAPAETLMGVEVEMANGNNCALAGDGFCDTPADYLSGRWECDSKGVSVIKQMDPAGNYFCSDGSLIMSYSAETCASRFSPSQVGAMHTYLAEELSSHFMPNAPCEKITPILADNLEFPGNRVALNTPNRRVFFKWKAVPNASGYVLEVSLLANFGTVAFRGHTRDTSLEVVNLNSSRPYYWRIRPFNAMYACRTFSNSRSFTINQSTTALPELNTVRAVQVFPNPVQPGAEIRLRFEAEDNLKLELSLLNALGERVYLQNLSTSIGQNEVLLHPNSLPKGLYYLWLKNESGALSRKLVVH